jgi:hypothetical protein
MDLPELAYRYVLTAKDPITVLAGTARIPELLACIRYSENGALPADVMERIRRVDVAAQFLDLSRWPAI